MTDPTPQTTPTRDEAVRELLQSNLIAPGLYATSTVFARGRAAMAAETLKLLASAPAPASGGVDAVARAAILDALKQAASGGAAGMADYEITAIADDLIAALSPAATPVSEAEPGEGMVEMAEIARIVSEWRHGPILSAEALRQIAALAKPASEPAGGDVPNRQVIRDAIASAGRSGAMGWADYEIDEATDDLIAALSSSAGPAAEVVGWTGPGSIDALKKGEHGTLYPRPPTPLATALYAHPAPATVEMPETCGPYEARICKDMPAECCDYGVVSLSEGREVCRVWREQDARAIAAALAPATEGRKG